VSTEVSYLQRRLALFTRLNRQGLLRENQRRPSRD
jgi:hypothetical protein